MLSFFIHQMIYCRINKNRIQISRQFNKGTTSMSTEKHLKKIASIHTMIKSKSLRRKKNRIIKILLLKKDTCENQGIYQSKFRLVIGQNCVNIDIHKTKLSILIGLIELHLFWVDETVKYGILNCAFTPIQYILDHDT